MILHMAIQCIETDLGIYRFSSVLLNRTAGRNISHATPDGSLLRKRGNSITVKRQRFRNCNKRFGSNRLLADRSKFSSLKIIVS